MMKPQLDQDPPQERHSRLQKIILSLENKKRCKNVSYVILKNVSEKYYNWNLFCLESSHGSVPCGIEYEKIKFKMVIAMITYIQCNLGPEGPRS